MATQKKKSKSALIVWLDKWAGLTIFYTLSLLPLSLLWTLGRGIGKLAWRLNGTGVRVTKKNLELCYPSLNNSQREQLGRESLHHCGMLLTEMCAIYQRSGAWAERQIQEVKGQSVIDRALEKKQGLIVVAPHLGNWELFSNIIPKLGDASALYMPLKKPHVSERVLSARAAGGMNLIPISRRGMAQLVRSIKSGGITLLLPDQSPAEGSGEYADFYDIPTYTVTLVHSLIQRCHSPVVLAFNQRTKNGFITHYIEPEPEIYSEDKVTSLTALNKAVERCIAICPEQYQWEYKRFKRNKPDSENPYQKI